MEFDEFQRDALKELINVAFGRAAAALSKLTGHRVEIEAPKVTICVASELRATLDRLKNTEIASVHQIFSGAVAGDAMLVLDAGGAASLKRLLTDEPALPLAVDHGARDVLTEVGNILLNACLGTLGNLLNVHVTFSVPRLTLTVLDNLLGSVVVSGGAVRYALVVQAAFRLRAGEVEGYLVIVLSVDSLDRLFRAIRDAEAGRMG